MNTFRELADDSAKFASHFRRFFNTMALTSGAIALGCFSYGIYSLLTTSFPQALAGVLLIGIGLAGFVNSYIARGHARFSYRQFMAMRESNLKNADRFEKR